MTAERVEPSAFDAVLTAALDGESWAFNHLYERWAGRMKGFALARGAPDADEIANDVMLRAFRSIGSFEGGEDRFGSWLFTIARNRLIDEHRRNERRPPIVEAPAEPATRSEPSAETVALDRLSIDDVALLLETLTDDQRDVIAMRIVADLSIEQVAQTIGKPVTAIKALQRRGLRRLQKEILNKVVSP